MAKLHHFSRLRRAPVALMLLAALAIVFHGGARVMAHPMGGAKQDAVHIHDNCASHLKHGADAAPIPSAASDMDTNRNSKPAWQLDCCAASSAVVLPTLDDTVLAALASSRGVHPQPSALIEGLTPTAPSKPPRTSYQG